MEDVRPSELPTRKYGRSILSVVCVVVGLTLVVLMRESRLPTTRQNELLLQQPNLSRRLQVATSSPATSPSTGTKSGKFLGTIFQSIARFLQRLFPPRPPAQPPTASPLPQPTPIPLTAPAPTPTPPKCTPSAPPLPGKKGAAFTLPNEGVVEFPKIIALRPYWNYGWGPKQLPNQPPDIEFVPMIWGKWSVQSSITDTILPQIAKGQTKRILGFNEPDSKTQSNIAVESALTLWPLFETAGVSLVSPSCVQPDGPWMKTFMKNVTDTCKRVDWVGVHWYGSPSFASFSSRMRAAHALHNERPLLITEFAVADFTAETVEENKFSRQAVLAFMKQALPWLESQDWIAGYTWYPYNITNRIGTSSALFNERNELTPLGLFYASVRTDNPEGNQSIN